MKVSLSGIQLAIYAFFFASIGFAVGRWPMIRVAQQSTVQSVEEPQGTLSPSQEKSKKQTPELEELYQMLNPDSQLFRDELEGGGEGGQSPSEQEGGDIPIGSDLGTEQFYPTETPLPVPMPAASEPEELQAQQV